MTKMNQVSAAFMALGIHPHLEALLPHWDGGHLELMQDLTSYSEYSVRLFTAGCEVVECPGVYPYEVDEEFGRWIGQQMLAGPGGGVNIPHAECCHQLRVLAFDFFERGTRRLDRELATEEVLNLAKALHDVPLPGALN